MLWEPLLKSAGAGEKDSFPSRRRFIQRFHMHNFVYFTMKRRKKQDKLKNALGKWAKTEKAQG